LGAVWSRRAWCVRVRVHVHVRVGVCDVCVCMPVPGPVLAPVHWYVAVFLMDHTQHLLFVKQYKLQCFLCFFFSFSYDITHGQMHRTRLQSIITQSKAFPTWSKCLASTLSLLLILLPMTHSSECVCMHTHTHAHTHTLAPRKDTHTFHTLTQTHAHIQY